MNRKEVAALSKRNLRQLEAIADDAVHSAAASVAQLLGIDMAITALHARTVPAQDVADAVGADEQLTVALYLQVEGDAPGHAAFVCPFNVALSLVDVLMGQPEGTTQELDELSESALRELGNILTSSYLNALAAHTGLTFLPTPPQLAVDMAYALVSAIMVGSTQAYQTEAISIVTEFEHGTGFLHGHFVYIADPGALPVLVEGLKEAA